NENYYFHGREWPYKDIKPRIICEEYMVDESQTGLKDYKIMCFNGKPKIIQVISDRKDGGYLLNHFDLHWNKLRIERNNFQESPIDIERPDCLKEMIEISKILSKDIPFVRIDLYSVEEKVLFGELTFFPVSGFMDFKDKKLDLLIGSWIQLPIND